MSCGGGTKDQGSPKCTEIYNAAVAQVKKEYAMLENAHFPSAGSDSVLIIAFATDEADARCTNDIDNYKEAVHGDSAIAVGEAGLQAMVTAPFHDPEVGHHNFRIGLKKDPTGWKIEEMMAGVSTLNPEFDTASYNAEYAAVNKAAK